MEACSIVKWQLTDHYMLVFVAAGHQILPRGIQCYMFQCPTCNPTLKVDFFEPLLLLSISDLHPDVLIPFAEITILFDDFLLLPF